MSYDTAPSRYDDIKEALDQTLPDAKERRRYALLQAAAIILSGLYGNDEKAEASVIDAEYLLEIIERHEKEQG